MKHPLKPKEIKPEHFDSGIEYACQKLGIDFIGPDYCRDVVMFRETKIHDESRFDPARESFLGDTDRHAGLMTVHDLSNKLNISVSDICLMAGNDIIPCLKIGPFVRFCPKQIGEFLHGCAFRRGDLVDRLRAKEAEARSAADGVDASPTKTSQANKNGREN